MRMFALGPLRTNTFVLYDRSLHEAIVIDAPPESHSFVGKLLQKVDCVVKELWLTHGHWDHVFDMHYFQEQGAKILMHEGDRPWVEDQEWIDAIRRPGFDFTLGKIDQWIEDGDLLNAFGETARVLHVPGHSEGNVLYYFEKDKRAFVGDVIFKRSIGRHDLPGSDWNKLKNSIQKKIYTLPDDTVLYPGHGPETTVQDEKKENPYVRPQENLF